MTLKECSVYWGSHGCSLAPGHPGDCVCLLLIYQHPWIWMDTGGYCNFWDGKEIGFLHEVCSYREQWALPM